MRSLFINAATALTPLSGVPRSGNEPCDFSEASWRLKIKKF
jgi:hypothetical protein